MKPKKYSFLLAVCFLLCTNVIFSLELTLEATSKVPNIDPAELPVLAEINGSYGDKMNFGIKYDWDTVWHSTLGGGFGVTFGHIDVGIGFFVGLYDFKFETLEAGIIGTAGIHFTDYWLLKINAGASGQRHFVNAKYGFWLPHIYTDIFYEYSDYTDAKKTETVRTYFGIRPTFFSKNVPFRIKAELRFDENFGIYPGVGLDFLITRSWIVYIKADAFMNGFLQFTDYRATLGITFSYPERDY